MDREKSKRIMQNPVYETESIIALNQDLTRRLNTISDWLGGCFATPSQQEVSEGEGAYVGVGVNEDPTKDVDYARRKILYPAYQTFCYRNKLKFESITEFGTQIIGCLT